MPTGEARAPTTEPVLQDATAEGSINAQQDADAEALADRYVEDAIARAAPTKPPAKPNKETWRDWLPPGAPEPTDLLTRAELIEQLQAEGLSVSAFDLRNWQSAGIVPYGINRWDKETQATRTFYPLVMVDIIRTLRALQTNGHKLSDIGPMLLDQFGRILGSQKALGSGHDGLPSVRHITVADAAVIRSSDAAHASVSTAPPGLKAQLVEMARNHERAFGLTITHAEVRMVDDRGRPMVHRFDLRRDPGAG